MTDNTTTNGDSTVDQPQEDSQEIIECPNCANPRRRFLIVDGKCDSCRTKDERGGQIVATLGWPEVRHRRNLLIAALDWTQLEDSPPETKMRYQTLRQGLRDITKKPDVQMAWFELDRLEIEVRK